MTYKARRNAINSGKVKSHDYMINKLHEKIDRRAKKGKVEEDGEYAARHYDGTDNDGNRRWTF